MTTPTEELLEAKYLKGRRQTIIGLLHHAIGEAVSLDVTRDLEDLRTARLVSMLLDVRQKLESELASLEIPFGPRTDLCDLVQLLADRAADA